MKDKVTGEPFTVVPSTRKESTNKTFQLLMLATLAFSASSLAFSSTVAVGKCTTLPFYNSIQTAVNSVPAGSTIKVCPGNYSEQVLINKSLTLAGVSGNGVSGANGLGANNPTVISPSAGVQVNASDLYANGDPIAAQIAVVTPSGASQPIVVNVSGLTVDGSNNQIGGCGIDLVGIYYQNASGALDHVTARYQELSQNLFGCQDGLAIYAQGGYGGTLVSAVTIENNSVHDYDKNGITVDGDKVTGTVTGNYVVGIGATPLTAQNGIQISDGASVKVSNNIVTDDVYVNPPDCASNNSCYSASGILLYDSGGKNGQPLIISGNTVSNTQGGIVAYGDSLGTADYNNITSNKVTTSPAAGPYLIDGIDLCSNNNMATSNIVMNSSGSGIHIDSQCTESTGQSGNGSMVSSNTINDACAGVLTGTGGSSQSGNSTYNVLQTVFSGDSCPANGNTVNAAKARVRPNPLRH